MLRFLPLLFTLACAPDTGTQAEDACDIDPDVAPEFALADVNPGSATYGQTLTRSSFLGEVVVIYWAVST